MFRILDSAAKYKKDLKRGTISQTLSGKIIGELFFEPSTRTQESFKAAAHRLGATVQGFSQAAGTSLQKGESFYDTVMTFAQYADLLVMRTPWEGSQRAISEKINIPIVNAGDGANQHPTQTLLDIFSIRETQGRLDDLDIAVIGDLKYGRTVHSLVQAMTNFNTTFTFVSPAGLELPAEYKSYLTSKKIQFSETPDMKMAIRGADIAYMTRIQKERFADPMDYEKARGKYIIDTSCLSGTKDNLKILHPMPRVGEIDYAVDQDEKAYYFHQTENGVYIRMAVMNQLLGQGK